MGVKKVKAEIAKDWLDADEAIIIDVREPFEHHSQRIIGSDLSPADSICSQKIKGLNKKVLIYCQKGRRGANACQRLVEKDGAVEVYNIEGGIEAWIQAGFPVEEAERKVLPLDRQVQLTIGVAVFMFSLLAYFAHPAFIFGAAFFGAGLINAALTGWCGLAKVIAKMPWNNF